MLELFTHNKIAVVVVAILVAGGSWFALTQQSEPVSLLSTQTVADNGPDGELVATLLALRAVKLDGTIFTDPAFTSLQDFSTQIVPEPIGRPNPFAPLTPAVAPTVPQDAQLFAPATSKTVTPPTQPSQKPSAKKKTPPAASPSE